MRKQSGFTAIELLITLFVAAAFLIAGYQLFNVVIKDGGQARSESRAGNVAYDYMRRYSASATLPCTTQPILSNSALSIDGLTNPRITVSITCPEYTTTSLSKIEVTVTYNNPPESVKYATYVNGTGAPAADVTEGLIAWWKFNGNANASIGTADGVVTNAIPVPGPSGKENTAYSFNGTNAKIVFPLTNFPATINTITVSVWVKQATAQAGAFASSNPIDGANALAMYIPSTDNNIYWYLGPNVAGALVVAHSASWLNTWNFWTFTSSPTDGMRMYRNGTQIGNNNKNSTFTKGTKTFEVGLYNGTVWWPGSVDDMRIYDRVLTPSEILTLYGAGAK